MPQLGLEVTEGTVAAIHVEVGASVAKDEPLLELETDKALTDVVAPRDAVVGRIDVALGDTVELGATLIVLVDELGEQPTAVAPAGPAVRPVPTRPTPPASRTERVPVLTAAGSEPSRNDYGRLRSAPVARRAADQLGIELSTVAGTGPRGRITLADVKQAAATAPRESQPSVGDAGAELTPLPAVRRAIARRMTRSQAIPQFSLEREIDATRLLADKASLPSPQPGAPKATINDMLVQALGEAVLRHPQLATSYVESEAGEPSFSRRPGADVGLAVATDRGLVVPVIRGAHERTLAALAADRVRLVGAARSGRLTIEEMSGATVTLSNLGGFGVDRFGAMLNPGEAAILAVGRTVERVVARGRGIVVVPTLSLSLTVDHRVIDGADGAAVLVDLAELLEGAMTWRP
jgi:pyruvate dehydrogenase E2 component (dihydrolipoamide acetyltransferase)